MITGHLKRCFAYDAWANRKTLTALQQAPRQEERPTQVMAHILASQRVWLRRLRGEDSSGLAIWPRMSLDECAALLDENQQGFQRLLSDMAEERLGETIAYRTSTGVDFRTPVADILTHVLLHGPYHRGQLAIPIRQLGGEPPGTDYVLFVREGG